MLLAVGMAGDKTINHGKLFIKPDIATSQEKRASFAVLACLHA